MMRALELSFLLSLAGTLFSRTLTGFGLRAGWTRGSRAADDAPVVGK